MWPIPASNTTWTWFDNWWDFSVVQVKGNTNDRQQVEIKRVTTVREFLSHLQDDVKSTLYTCICFEQIGSKNNCKDVFFKNSKGGSSLCWWFSAKTIDSKMKKRRPTSISSKWLCIHSWHTSWKTLNIRQVYQNPCQTFCYWNKQWCKHYYFAVHQFEKEEIKMLPTWQSSLPTFKNYFETIHRKSSCDGLVSIIQQACFNAVKYEKAVLGYAFKLC